MHDIFSTVLLRNYRFYWQYCDQRIHWHLLGLFNKQPKRKRKIYCLENNGTLTQVFYANAIHHLQTACYLEQHMTHLKSTGTWTINTKHLVNSHLQRLKKLISFIWKKLNSKIKPNVSLKKYLKSVKAPELFRKTYFQIKVNKSGRCHNLRPGQVPWGNFCCDCSCWGLIFMLFSYFVYIVHFT